MKRANPAVISLLSVLGIFAFAAGIRAAEDDVYIRFDMPTIERGYTAASRDGNLLVALPPGSTDREIGLRIRHYGEEGVSTPEGKGLVSGIYSFDFKYLEEGSGPVKFSKPLTIALKYGSENDSEKHMYFHNPALGKWSLVAPDDIDEGRKDIRAKLKIGYARIAALEEEPRTGIASWYEYRDCMCAASPDYPKGSFLKVTSLENGRSVTVKVNDYGPDRSIFPERVIDLDLVAFRELCSPRLGLADVKVEKLRDKDN